MYSKECTVCTHTLSHIPTHTNEHLCIYYFEKQNSSSTSEAHVPPPSIFFFFNFTN